MDEDGKTTEGIWFRTDEHQELIDSIEHSAFLSKCLIEDIRKWKWLIISLHQTIHITFICALDGYDAHGISILKKKKAKKRLELLNENSDDAEAWSRLVQNSIDYFPELFKKTMDPEFLPCPYTLIIAEQSKLDIKTLSGFRDQFVHFGELGWSIELSGMPRIISNISKVIEHLAVEHPSFSRHLTDENVQQIKQSLEEIRSNISQWARQHDIQDGSRPSPG